MQLIIPNYIPPPCQRPRLGKNRNAYSPSSKPEETLAWMLRSEINRQNITCKLPHESPCYIIVDLFYIKIRPVRGDLDNILKFVMDACQKAAIIKNDRLFHDVAITANPANMVATIIEIGHRLNFKAPPVDHKLETPYGCPYTIESGASHTREERDGIKCFSAPPNY